ncbi:patatin-domain-containing protein, partial [Microstroma glucosiphilum]
MLDPLLTQPFSDPDAIGAFAEALREDQGKQELPIAALSTAGAAAQAWAKLGFSSSSKSPQLTSGSPSLLSPDGHAPASTPTLTVPSAEQRKVGKISAVSDFAPIRERTARRPARGAQDTGRREGLLYSMLRWPLLLTIFLVIGLEFAAYVFTRQIVNVVEWLVAHRGRKGVLRRQMRNAKDFQTWKDTALELDDHMEHDAWKRQDSSGLYDWILVKKVSHSLKTFREQDDVQELMLVLTLCCTNNFAGTENFRLYSETYYGSKYLIEAYLAEVELGLDYMSKTEKIPLEQKRAFFRDVAKNLGKSGLALSGGGSFGYYHIGLVKALLDANLLPRIVSGTSAGGLIAALTCTRTDEELSRLLVPELADRITACEEPITIWAKRAWQTGARFDPIEWAEKASFFTLGSLTFEEAFKRTGKVLNVSVIPSEKNSPVKLLNHITAPRCVIWSALLASAAVPGLLPPVCLMQKTRKGEYVPWNWGHRFRDGSLRVDIPLQDLHSMFQVNYPIVSQVNPHVHLFFFAPKGMPGRPVAHRKGKGWRGGFLLSASEHVLKLHLSVNFKIIRDLDLLPAILGTDWSGVFLQRFGGAVTIWPKTRFLDWVRILSDPDRPELRRMIRVGQQATWPKLHMIENRIRLERAVARGRKACRRALRA